MKRILLNQLATAQQQLTTESSALNLSEHSQPCLPAARKHNNLKPNRGLSVSGGLLSQLKQQAEAAAREQLRLQVVEAYRTQKRRKAQQGSGSGSATMASLVQLIKQGQMVNGVAAAEKSSNW
jgi:hypothetical protein